MKLEFNNDKTKRKRMKSIKWTLMLGTLAGFVSCGVDMPKETQSSFENNESGEIRH